MTGHSDTWHGGEDTWYSDEETRVQWRTCHCPVCGQALGWQWTRDITGTRDTLDTRGIPGTRDTRAEYSWVGLRLGRVVDWSDSLLGPLADLPQLLHSLG